jgi:hypothetical protein
MGQWNGEQNEAGMEISAAESSHQWKEKRGSREWRVPLTEQIGLTAAGIVEPVGQRYKKGADIAEADRGTGFGE